MSLQSEYLLASWLQSIINLVQDHDYNEAYTLAEYFPAIPGRKLVQCAALLAQGRRVEAEDLLKTVPATMQALAPDFVYMLDHVQINLLRAGRRAIPDKHLYLASLCLEGYLLTHPKSARTVIDDILKLASEALIADNLDLGMASFQRVMELDHSPSRLIQYAEAALYGRKPESAQSLSDFARECISQALNRLPPKDVSNRLKAAKLLALDVETFKMACKVFRRLLRDDPSVKSQVSALLSHIPQFD
jgi:hypothetical protein